MVREYWGLDIGGTKTAFIRGDGEGHILSRQEIATRSAESWEALLLTLLPKVGQPRAIGVSCGNPLDSEKGVILSPPNLPGWDDVPITAWLSARYHAPAYLENDANACALAEWRFGAGQGCRNMVFLTFGTGFGAGLILNGRLYRGASGMAGEIGHVRYASGGPVGYGKAGSYEGFCSGGGIAQLAGVSAKATVMMAEAGDPGAQEALTHSAQALGMGCAMLIDLFNPERIVIGSIFARAERWFRQEMERVIAKEALPGSRALCRVLPAVLGDAIGDIAALSVAIDGSKGDAA